MYVESMYLIAIIYENDNELHHTFNHFNFSTINHFSHTCTIITDMFKVCHTYFDLVITSSNISPLYCTSSGVCQC